MGIHCKDNDNYTYSNIIKRYALLSCVDKETLITDRIKKSGKSVSVEIHNVMCKVIVGLTENHGPDRMQAEQVFNELEDLVKSGPEKSRRVQ